MEKQQAAGSTHRASRYVGESPIWVVLAVLILLVVTVSVRSSWLGGDAHAAEAEAASCSAPGRYASASVAGPA
jgi:hypothetical protein